MCARKWERSVEKTEGEREGREARRRDGSKERRSGGRRLQEPNQKFQFARPCNQLMTFSRRPLLPRTSRLLCLRSNTDNRLRQSATQWRPLDAGTLNLHDHSDFQQQGLKSFSPLRCPAPGQWSRPAVHFDSDQHDSALRRCESFGDMCTLYLELRPSQGNHEKETIALLSFVQKHYKDLCLASGFHVDQRHLPR